MSTTTTTRTGFAENVQGVTAKAHALMTRLNLYYAGVALLALINLYLLVQIAFTWRAARSQDATALEQQAVSMRAAEIATKPLEGLDDKLSKATADSDTFYAKRLPTAYSEVLAELGVLTKQHGVKMARGQYVYSPVLDGAAGALTEVRMDASFSGDYRPLVLFINSLERDKMFFLIRGVTLAGQSTGTVGLRLSLTTYLRPGKGAAAAIKADTVTGGEAR
ncbi:MAG TPA: hypothetical protein VK596_04475 [Edaphobacter sp.]|nr:hypothetical protein [Edaphobacter sp.]